MTFEELQAKRAAEKLRQQKEDAILEDYQKLTIAKALVEADKIQSINLDTKGIDNVPFRATIKTKDSKTSTIVDDSETLFKEVLQAMVTVIETRLQNRLAELT